MLADNLKRQCTPNTSKNHITELSAQLTNAYIDTLSTKNARDIKTKIKGHIKHLKDHKGPRLDGIPNYALKRLTPKAIDYMATLFTM